MKTKTKNTKRKPSSKKRKSFSWFEAINMAAAAVVGIPVRAKFKKIDWEKGEDWSYGHFDGERIYDIRRMDKESVWIINCFHHEIIKEVGEINRKPGAPLEKIIEILEMRFQGQILRKYFDFTA